MLQPTFEERAGSVAVTFRAPIGSGTKLGLSEEQHAVLEIASDPQPIQLLMERCGKANRTKFRDQVLRPLLEAGLLAMTIPEKPRSSRQRYGATEAGEAVLKG